MLTKKYFEAIAKILKHKEADYGEVIEFANYLQAENPRFDKERFIKACGLEGDNVQ